MKKKFIRVAYVVIFFAAILIFLEATADYSGKGLISPSCEVLAIQHGMVKSGLKYGGIEFSQADFLSAIGTDTLSTITIREIPPVSEGTLMLNDTYVVKNQVLTREDLDKLKFVSSGSEQTASSFTFSTDKNEYTLTCSLIFTDNVNFAPTFAADETVQVWTQKNISCFGQLMASDPENDDLIYEVLSYPKKGLLVLDKETGTYKFSPYANVKGMDSFVCRAQDCNGNYSEAITVSIEIDNVASDLVFADMEDDPAHNAAIFTSAKELMSYDETDGKYYFSPDDTVTREEFLVAVMNLFGARNVPEIKSSGFTDDSAISTNAKGYVASAYFLGIISGDIEGGKIYFRPQDTITKAEAAVMINNILGFEPTVSTSSFSDAEEIPIWAESSLCALTEIGVLKPESTGSIRANDTLTKAQVAQILLSLINYTGA